jgi:hypothetical protein
MPKAHRKRAVSVLHGTKLVPGCIAMQLPSTTRAAAKNPREPRRMRASSGIARIGTVIA